MRLAFMHPVTGKPLLVPTRQVVVYNDDGLPVAVTYEHGGLLVHSDAGHPDFDRIIRDLGIQKVEPTRGG